MEWMGGTISACVEVVARREWTDALCLTPAVGRVDVSAEDDWLLAGPRGRRVCLASATAIDEELYRLVFWLGRQYDDGASVLIRFGDGGGDAADFDDPTPTPEDVAASILAIDLDGVDEANLRRALRESVDSARYWQEPDSEDIIASLALVRRALEPLAVRLGRMLSDAGGERRDEQWAVEWTDPDTPSVTTSGAATLLTEWGIATAADEERAERERPRDPQANWSGTWWSVPLGLVQTRSTIADALELVEDSLGWDSATLIPMRGAGRTLEIASAADWARLCRSFPLEVTASRRHDWFRVTGRDGRWLIPDWRRVAEHWDAVHLTTRGYLAAANTLIEVDQEYGSMIAGWAPDCTIWLSDVVSETTEPRQQWRRAEKSDEWTLDS